jgi:hypothetical protein
MYFGQLHSGCGGGLRLEGFMSTTGPNKSSQSSKVSTMMRDVGTAMVLMCEKNLSLEQDGCRHNYTKV